MNPSVVFKLPLSLTKVEENLHSGRHSLEYYMTFTRHDTLSRLSFAPSVRCCTAVQFSSVHVRFMLRRGKT